MNGENPDCSDVGRRSMVVGVFKTTVQMMIFESFYADLGVH